jgi:Tol biopolymer transport system component
MHDGQPSGSDPGAFSPDGKQIAFTCEYDGNVDVFRRPAGVAKRLTWHAAPDRVPGWTPDSQPPTPEHVHTRLLHR